MMDTTKYPIGIQSFEILRTEGYAYVDKTAYIYNLVRKGSRTYFLSRPRRFGKSLLLSTLNAYFTGRKELFDGLAIYELEEDWTSYPVLRFDFSRAEAGNPEGLNNFIVNRLAEYEREYGITDIAGIKEVGDRFGTLIERVSKRVGKRVVVLIDEYDKGIHEAIDNPSLLDANQRILRPFFSQIKAQDEHLRFCFITGVSRFRNYTLFSGFNNPDDISMDVAYAALCGITKQEMLHNFQAGLQALADSNGQTFDDTLEALRLKYDGYRFTKSAELVFNPFSIVNCLKKRDIANYWIKSGTAKVFVDYLSKSRFDILELESLWVDQEKMEGTYSTQDPIPLLFQTGYLTIKECDYGLYRLGIPNGEVRSALVDDLIPRYMGIDNMPRMLHSLRRYLGTGDADGRKVYKIGAVFSPETRTLAVWQTQG